MHFHRFVLRNGSSENCQALLALKPSPRFQGGVGVGPFALRRRWHSIIGAHRNDEFFGDAWCCRNGWVSLAGKSRFEASIARPYLSLVFMTCLYESVIQSVFTAMETARNSG